MTMTRIGQMSRPPKSSRWGFPEWCHHYCGKMRIQVFDKATKRLEIHGSAAFLVILPANIDVFDGWLVQWRVVYSRNEKTEGQVFFTTDELAAAFGILKEISKGSGWLAERFGAHSACQGKYIMWQRGDKMIYLNVPCPGTGHDGDPNISIEVNESMQAAVRELLLLP